MDFSFPQLLTVKILKSSEPLSVLIQTAVSLAGCLLSGNYFSSRREEDAFMLSQNLLLILMFFESKFSFNSGASDV